MSKQDPKLLASKQKWEPAAVARKYRIPVAIVRQTALEVGGGKPTRSLAKLYKALELKGYVVGGNVRITNLPEDTFAPDLSEQGPFVNA